MQGTKSVTKNNYILYILFIFLSGLLILVDYFSDKELSGYIPNQVNFELNLDTKELININNFNSIFEKRAQLISENIRLKNEVQDLRVLEIENQELIQKISSYESITSISDYENIDFYSTGFIAKNLNLEFLIYGGTNQQLKPGDLVVNEKGFVIGYLKEVFYSYSILETPYSSSFNLEVIDKYNNTYLVTSNGSMLFISSISIVNYKEDIDYLFTDLSLDHSGKFPLLDTREINFEIKNNQINATYVFDEIFTFNSNLFIPRFK
tara:strand:+ start:1059 stop:1853 length:795 start_codon:yes stop_codon:yes gene_type:complete